MNDLSAHALRLLCFVEDSISESLDDPASRQALLGEADDAIRILQRTLVREDATKHAQLMLLGIFDQSFQDAAKQYPQSLPETLKELLEIKLRARILFQAVT